MKLNQRQKIILGILLASFIIGALAYSQLPTKVAIHWMSNGFPQGYTNRFWGAFLLPLTSLALYLLFYLGRKMDRKRSNVGRASKDFENFEIIVQAVLLYLFILILWWNTIYPIDVARWLSPGIGLVYIAFGNLIVKAMPNWTIGIRTPWTLKSSTSWRKTHRLARWLLYSCGFLTLYGMILPQLAFWFVLLPVILTAIICIIYSYFASEPRYRK